MKTIVLIPVKNEGWILENTLQNITPHVDHVILSDQQSTDSTREIAAKFPNVSVIENTETGHSNKVRWTLLDQARAQHGQRPQHESNTDAAGNLIICIDADEIIQPAAILYMKGMIDKGEAKPGDVFRFKWIQLFRSVRQYRNDGAWKDSFKNIAFIDNPGTNEYKRDFVINDHTSRVPDTHIGAEFEVPYPLLHYHFVAWKRNEMKQAWYRCTELMAGKRNAKRINNTYRVTMLTDKIKAYPAPDAWYDGIVTPTGIENATSIWHHNEIKKFFADRGILFFEDLQIWHIPELEEEFVKQTGRKPVSKTYPAALVFLNEIKNWVRNFRFK